MGRGGEVKEGMDVEDRDVARPCQDCLVWWREEWRRERVERWVITEEVAKVKEEKRRELGEEEQSVWAKIR